MAVAMAAALAPAESGLFPRLARSGLRPAEHWARTLGSPLAPTTPAEVPAPPAEPVVDLAEAISPEFVETDGGTVVDAAGVSSTAIISPTALGRDVMFGGLACAIHGVLTPFAEQVRRWLPAEARQGAQGVLDTAARAGESVIAFTAAGALSARFQALGRMVSGVPVLGSAGPLGTVSRAVLGHLVVSLVKGAAHEEAPSRATTGEIYMAAECALCGDEFVHGSRVQVLSCGHACLCGSPCAGQYLERQGDCPVCRRVGVFGITSVRC